MKKEKIIHNIKNAQEFLFSTKINNELVPHKKYNLSLEEVLKFYIKNKNNISSNMLLTYQIMLKLKTISIDKIASIEYQLYNFSKLKLTKQYYLKIEDNQIKVIKINNFKQNSKYAEDHQTYLSCKVKINSNESITKYITEKLNKEKIYSDQEFDYDDTYSIGF